MMSNDKKEKVQFTNHLYIVYQPHAQKEKRKKKDKMVSLSPFKYLRNQNEFLKIETEIGFSQ